MMNTVDGMRQQPFDPTTDGFRFPNYWTLDPSTSDKIRNEMNTAITDIFTFLAPIPGIAPLRDRVSRTAEKWVNDASVQVYGLCGGMAFAALDYYKAGHPITDQSRESDEITPELRNYIVKRMINSLAGRNVARVLAWMVVKNYVPLGAGKRLLLRWTRAECAELQKRIARNGAWPIALIGESKDPCHNHQVLAYKSEPAGDGWEIQIYDVNYPGNGRALTLDFHGPTLALGEDGVKDSWKPLRGLFCEDYAPARPQFDTQTSGLTQEP